MFIAGGRSRGARAGAFFFPSAVPIIHSVPALPPSKTLPPGRPAAPEADSDERPTIIPSFDPEAFARDSEIKQRAAFAADGEPTINQARRLHLDGEHEQALFLLAHLLEIAPLHPEATHLSADCRAALERECLSSVGSESAILVAAISSDELKTFGLDNVSGFLLSLMDGATNVEAILDISGLPRLLALRHLRNLLERGVVGPASGHRLSPPPEPAGGHRIREEPVADEEATIESGVLPGGIGVPTLDAVPVLLVAPGDLNALVLDPHARALAALVNDNASVEEILAATKTDLVEGAALFERLAEDGIIGFV